MYKIVWEQTVHSGYTNCMPAGIKETCVLATKNQWKAAAEGVLGIEGHRITRTRK